MNHASHAALHVVQEVAVEKPVTEFICVKLDHYGGHGSDVNGVFERCMASVAIDDPKEMVMEMHRMMHHRSIDHVDKYMELSHLQ